jgi:hypothetical protein
MANHNLNTDAIDSSPQLRKVCNVSTTLKQNFHTICIHFDTIHKLRSHSQNQLHSHNEPNIYSSKKLKKT